MGMMCERSAKAGAGAGERGKEHEEQEEQEEHAFSRRCQLAFLLI